MVEAFLSNLCKWAAERREVLALGVVGSQVRGTARPDSDVDLVLVVRNPGPFFLMADWTERFGVVRTLRDEDYGRLRARRVHYATGLEVEFGFVNADWVNTDPVDPGTKRVVTGGLRCLYDPEMLLARLVAAVESD